MTTFTEKVEEIELNIKLAHNYKLGETLCLQLSQFPEVAEALIKAHQAEISRVLESLPEKKAFDCPFQHDNDDIADICFHKEPDEWFGYNQAIDDAVEAINKIKGELQ